MMLFSHHLFLDQITTDNLPNQLRISPVPLSFSIMTRFSLALFVAAMAAPSASACCWFRGLAPRNYRSGEGDYSTASSSKAELTLPGVELYISPKDSFDFLPSSGHAVKGRKILFDEEIKQTPDEFREHVKLVQGSEEEVAKWVRSQLGPDVKKYQAPRPNESLPGKVLTIETVKDIINSKDIGDAVICHKIEEDATFCHKLNDFSFSVTEIIVSPNGKPSSLWAGCHVMEDEDMCHLMNVGDMVFISPPEKFTTKRLRVVNAYQ